MQQKINIGIIGAAGYTGGEMIRLLLNHPNANIVFAQSKSQQGKKISAVHRDLESETDLKFGMNREYFEEGNTEVDLLFLCVGAGEAKAFLHETTIPERIKIIDLSHDFRLDHSFENRDFIYGLPELNKENISAAANIANPGCFATAIQLGLLPLAKAGLLKDVYTTGITGSTGAGQGLSPTSHFSWRANNIQPYKVLEHQHMNEIYRSLNSLQDSFPVSPEQNNGKAIHFVPWRGDFTRGIFTSSIVSPGIFLSEVYDLYKQYYRDHPFVLISESAIDLKQVVNTNKCLIHIEQQGDKVVIHTAIDNLLKGASGQAVQNMNIMFGLEETTGLKLKPNYF